MNLHVEGEMARQRLAEARDWAAREACLRRVRGEHQPLRVRIGLGLVRLGRWVAGTGDPARHAPGRAAA